MISEKNYQKMVGRRIRDARQLSGKTQREVSLKTDLDVSQISQYEGGKRIPKLYTLARLAKAVGVSIDQIVRMEK